MTAKRDLKRRVRLRQARTGESYVTARRRVIAARVVADEVLKGGAKADDEESGDDEPTGERDPAAGHAAAAPSRIENATPPGVSDEDDEAGTLPGSSDEDQAEEGARAKASSAGDGAPASVEEEARARAAAMTSAEEEARARAAAIALAEEEVRAAAAAAIAEAGARATMGRPMGPATAAAVMEAIEISAAMTMARAEGNTAADPPARPLTNGAEVVELREVTAEAALLGFRCRITMFPSVLEAAELASVLLALRNALVGPGGSTGQARMFDVAFGLPSKPAPLTVRPYPPTAVLT
ncbi:MAG TPA: hypothetical protein VLM79_38680, partial [Kofleriaceae bacterium]|nr:hypothetical protein [Kofleriaceae bacterium]